MRFEELIINALVLSQESPFIWRIPVGDPSLPFLVDVTYYLYGGQRLEKWDLAAIQRRDRQLTLQDAVGRFLGQFTEIDLDPWIKSTIKATFIKRIVGIASRFQDQTLSQPDASNEPITDLFTERNVIALAIHCLSLVHQIPIIESWTNYRTDEHIFEDVDSDIVFEEASDMSFPAMMILREDHSELESMAQPSDRQRYPDSMWLPNALAHISRLSLSLLHLQELRDWPTVLHVLLLLNLIQKCLPPTRHWMRKDWAAGDAIMPMFEDLARSFYVCTDGGFVLSPSWNEE